MMSPFWRYSSVLLIGYLPFIGILTSLYDQNTIRKLQMPEVAHASAGVFRWRHGSATALNENDHNSQQKKLVYQQLDEYILL